MININIQKLINEHSVEVARLSNLKNYYLGKHDILHNTKSAHKPNNKLINNFAQNIVNTTCGYYLGKEVVYDSIDQEYIDAIQSVLKENDEQLHNIALAKDVSTFGIAYELIYLDELAQIRFAKLDTTSCIPVFNKTVDNSLKAVIRYYSVFDDDSEKQHKIVEVYEKETISYYKLDQQLTLIETKANVFDDIPITIYLNNEDKQGDFEQVISLIDAYNIMQSESINDFETFSDAYLAITNMIADESDIEQMRDNKLLMLDGDGKAEWLIKNVNDTYVENIKNRLQKDIFTFSNTVDMTDENFASNLSGVAIKYKLMGMENRVSITERYFKKSLMRRIRLITHILNVVAGSNFDAKNISITFTRNIAANDAEVAQTINQLRNIVSTDTLMQQLSFVTDVQKERERLEAENRIDIYPLYEETGDNE